MTAPDTLDAQLAQRLFGWICQGVDYWIDAEQFWHRTPPAYSTDPAATALVWQWLEGQRGRDDLTVAFEYWAGQVSCRIATHNGVSTLALDDGSTWPDALCRAALQLAEALAGEGER